jgi:uncharacterized protein (DUF1697 family)
MTRYVAFLGGINVGGHRVTMDALRAEFEVLGFTDVSTFIASGNVVFEATGRPAALERRIEHHLEARLGFPGPAFVRTAAAVRTVCAFEPFAEVGPGDTHHVCFLRAAPSAAAARAAEALSNDQDAFVVHGTELHRRIHGGLTDSSVKPSVLAQALGRASTSRNTTSLRKLAAKLDEGARR